MTKVLLSYRQGVQQLPFSIIEVGVLHVIVRRAIWFWKMLMQVFVSHVVRLSHFPLFVSRLLLLPSSTDGSESQVTQLVKGHA